MIDDLPQRMFSLSRDRREIFGISIPEQKNAIVINYKTRALERTFEVWPYASGYAMRMDAAADRVVVGGYDGTVYKVRIHENAGPLDEEITLGAGDFIWDVAAGAQYVGVIYSPGFTTPWLFVYSTLTWAVVDSEELGDGWESVAIHGDLIAVQGGVGIAGSTASGKLRIYKMIDDVLTLQTETTPFADLITTYGMTYGVPSAGR